MNHFIIFLRIFHWGQIIGWILHVVCCFVLKGNIYHPSSPPSLEISISEKQALLNLDLNWIEIFMFSACYWQVSPNSAPTSTELRSIKYIIYLSIKCRCRQYLHRYHPDHPPWVVDLNVPSDRPCAGCRTSCLLLTFITCRREYFWLYYWWS